MRREQVEIKKLGINGEGIGYINKKICFIQGALPNEIVDVEIIDENHKFLKGRVRRYIKISPLREKSFCHEDKYCQGCALTALIYSQHGDYKKGIVKDALKKYTEYDVESLPVKKTITAKTQKGYRHVVELPVAYFKGKVNVGIYQRESKYLTLMNQCLMQDPLINQCLQKIEDILNEHNVRDYHDKFKKGLRFLKMRNIDGQIQVVFVTGQDGLKEEVTKEIAQIPEIKSLFLTINTTRYQDFEKQGYKKIYGESHMAYQYENQQYLYSVKSEFPMNPEMENTKLNIIRSFIPCQAQVLSLNCGIGLMELSMNNEIIAIDEKNYHIQDAKNNAKFLRKNNVTFLCKNVNEAVILQCKKIRFDVVVVRNMELTAPIQQSLILSKVKDVIFVSDHPSTIAKGIEDLRNYYDVESIIPLDMYPYTAKVETIVKLHRK